MSIQFNRNVSLMFRFTADIIVKFSTFIYFIVLIRYEGTVWYGVYVFIFAFIGVSVILVSFGQNRNLVRIIAQLEDQKSRSDLFLSFVVPIFFSAIIMAIVFFNISDLLNITFLKVENAGSVLRHSVFLVVLIPVELITNAYYQSILKFPFFSGIEVVQVVANVLGMLFLFHLGYGLTEWLVLFSFLKLIVLIVLFVNLWVKKDIQFPLSLVSKDKYIEMFKFGYPITIMAINKWVLAAGDKFVLGFFLDATAIGVYGAIYSVANMVRVLGEPFWALLYPILASRFGKKSRVDLMFLSQKYSSMFLTLSIPAIVGLAFITPDVLILLGSDYAFPVFLIVALVLVGIFFDQLAALWQLFLYLEIETVFLQNISIAAGAINLGLNYFLIPILGLLAPALVTVISYIFMYGLMSLRMAKLGYPVGSVFNLGLLWKIVISSLLMGGGLYYSLTIELNTTIFGLLLPVVMGMLVYILSLLGFHKWKFRRLISIFR